MQVRHASVLLALAACRPLEFAEFPPECDPAVEICPPGSGSTTTGSPTTSDGGDGIQTVTSATTTTTTTTSTSSDSHGDTGPAPLQDPEIRSVSLMPDLLELAGSIDVEVVADNADGVRLAYPGTEVELEEGPAGQFHGQIYAYTGLANGQHDATLTPWRGDLEGETETRPYTLDLPTAGELFLWDTMPDHGLGQVEALRVTASGHVVALGTLSQNGVSRCFLHRRDLEGKYAEADDIRIIFPDKECQAIDLAVDGDVLYLLVSMMGGDGLHWRVGTAGWGEEPTILRTGAKDEKAYALARSPSGRTVICGTALSLAVDDTIDGRVWPLFGAPIELDYVAAGKQPHQLDETIRDCAFAGERLVAVGDIFGWLDEGNKPLPPQRTRPLLLEFDAEDVPTWHVAGLGPGNITQGSISELAIDANGRFVTGLHTCGDMCTPQGEIRIYEPGGNIWWQVTLGATILPPRDIAWSPAGYLVVATAEAAGNWSSKFVLQAFTPEPGKYAPVWNFSKAEMANLHLASAVAVGPGVVVGGGLGGAGFPALAFLRP